MASGTGSDDAQSRDDPAQPPATVVRRRAGRGPFRRRRPRAFAAAASGSDRRAAGRVQRRGWGTLLGTGVGWVARAWRRQPQWRASDPRYGRPRRGVRGAAGRGRDPGLAGAGRLGGPHDDAGPWSAWPVLALAMLGAVVAALCGPDRPWGPPAHPVAARSRGPRRPTAGGHRICGISGGGRRACWRWGGFRSPSPRCSARCSSR